MNLYLYGFIGFCTLAVVAILRFVSLVIRGTL